MSRNSHEKRRSGSLREDGQTTIQHERMNANKANEDEDRRRIGRRCLGNDHKKLYCVYEHGDGILEIEIKLKVRQEDSNRTHPEPGPPSHILKYRRELYSFYIHNHTSSNSRLFV